MDFKGKSLWRVGENQSAVPPWQKACLQDTPAPTASLSKEATSALPTALLSSLDKRKEDSTNDPESYMPNT